MPRKEANNGTGMFIYTVAFSYLDNQNNSVTTDTMEVYVPGYVSNGDTNIYINRELEGKISVLNGMHMPMNGMNMGGMVNPMPTGFDPSMPPSGYPMQ